MRAKFINCINESRISVLELTELTNRIIEKYEMDFRESRKIINELNKNIEGNTYDVPIELIIDINVSSEGFNEIKDFVENAKIGILYLGEAIESGSSGSYITINYIKRLNQENETKFGKEEDKYVIEKFPDGVILLYTNTSSLLHELTHAYDWYISKSKIEQSKYFKKSNSSKSKKSNSSKSNERERYVNSYHEINARLSEFIDSIYRKVSETGTGKYSTLLYNPNRGWHEEAEIDLEEYLTYYIEKIFKGKHVVADNYMSKEKKHKYLSKCYTIIQHIKENTKKIEKYAEKGQLDKIKKMVEEDKSNTMLFTLDALYKAIDNKHMRVIEYLVQNRKIPYRELDNINPYAKFNKVDKLYKFIDEHPSLSYSMAEKIKTMIDEKW